MATRSIDALAALLGDKPYILGPAVAGADAMTYAMLAGFLCPHFDSYLRRAITAHRNLVSYEQRMRARFYSEPCRRAERLAMPCAALLAPPLSV